MIGKNEQAEILKYLLGQRYRAEKRKKQLDDRLEEMNERKRSPVGAGRISSAPKNQGKKAEEPFLVFRISEIEDRICRQKQEIENAVVRVMNIIEYLPLNSIEREICELRHIDMKPWNIISAEIPMSRSQVNRRYNAAIDMLLNNRGIQKLIAKIAALDPDDGPVDEAVLSEYREKFRAQVGNDLNTALGVTALYDALKAKTNGATRLAILGSFDQVLSLSLLDKADQVREEQKKQRSSSQGGYTVTGEGDPAVDALVLQRYEAKKAKNFAEADRIRDELRQQGIEIADLPGGASWKRV